MQLHHPHADRFVPDGAPLPEALARTTHLAVGAHQDDLEILAFHGIAACYGQADQSFTGVTCTDGAGSPRSGPYAGCSNEDLCRIRREEQRAAAIVGRYGAMLQLGYTSAAARDAQAPELQRDLTTIFQAARPQTVYLHNLADKHDTHIAVALRCIAALRALPAADRPATVYGCEVWRSLDWLDDAEKVALSATGRQHLAQALLGVFDSQLAGGKRYDLATLGRRQANATYFNPRAIDGDTGIVWAMDLTPLIRDTALDIPAFVCAHIERLAQDVRDRLLHHMES